MLFETEDVEGFLRAAEENAGKYGRHGLRTFMAAHHLNCVVSRDDMRPWCFESWEAYNAMLDRSDAEGGAPERAPRPLKAEVPMNRVDPLRELDKERPGGFCTHCGHQVDSFDGLNSCPFCRTTVGPCAFSNDERITINWHELHILVVWAENYAQSQKDPKLFQVILAIVERYMPSARSTPMLSLSFCPRS